MLIKPRIIGTLSILVSQLLTIAPAYAQQVYQDDRGKTYYDFICHEHNSKGECTNYSFITPRSRMRGFYDDYLSPTRRYTNERYLQLYNNRGIYDSNYYNNRNGYYPYDYTTSPYDSTRYYRPSSQYYPSSSQYYHDNRYDDGRYYRDWYEQRYGRYCRSCDCDDDDDDCDD